MEMRRKTHKEKRELIRAHQEGFKEGFMSGKQQAEEAIALKCEEDYTAGQKHAFDLVGELAETYKNDIKCGDDWPPAEKKLHKRILQAQVNACRYAQVVIQRGTLGEDDNLPW